MDSARTASSACLDNGRKKLRSTSNVARGNMANFSCGEMKYYPIWANNRSIGLIRQVNCACCLMMMSYTQIAMFVSSIRDLSGW